MKEILSLLEQRNKSAQYNAVRIDFDELEKKLSAHPEKLKSLLLMEETGGDPAIVNFNSEEGFYTIYDCSKESPSGRRSLCYDNEALEKRKTNKPGGSAMSMAKEMGITLLDEQEYWDLQAQGDFDLKTSSWLLTPENVRKLGGALFGDKRFATTFIYHNGAESYYAARGFRGKLII